MQGLGSWGRNYVIDISNEECSCFQLLALDRWVTFVYGNVSSYTVTYAQVWLPLFQAEAELFCGESFHDLK